MIKGRYITMQAVISDIFTTGFSSITYKSQLCIPNPICVVASSCWQIHSQFYT